MAQKEIHFEIFKRQGAKGAWTLHDVVTVREKALSMAAELIADKMAAAVKVVKETYDGDTGDYLSLKIFEDGHVQLKVEPAAEDMPHALPCFKPDDLYSYHARATLTRLLREFLARKKITITELIHRADCLETLEATGTTYQHAVQKIAVAQAASTTMPVQQIIKTLNDLSTKAISRVYRDARRKYFPKVETGGFGALAEKLAGSGDGAYVFNGALAQHLAPCKSWNEKLLALLGVMSEAPVEGAGRALLLGSIDTVIAEVLGGSAALHELLGESENLGQALMFLVHLFVGNMEAEDEKRTGLVALAGQFAADGLPNSRTAVANRIIAELKSTRRLCPTSLLEELTVLRKLANSLVLGDPRYLSHENLIAAFTLRSRRLVANESIGEFLAELATPDAKIERLLIIEENIIGAENKRQLGGVLQQIVSSPPFEAYFVAGTLPVMARLRRLAELQARVRRSNFQDNQRNDFSDWLDRVANEVERRGKVLKSLQDNMSGPVDCALAILKLCSNNVLTEGRVAARARDLVLFALGQPGFLAGYMAQAKSSAGADGHDPERAMSELVQLLQRAGISRETGLKSIAA
jgi:hypothetical protein